MEVAAGTTEQCAAKAGQNRIPEIPVQFWHRARPNPAPKPIPHYKIVARAQVLDERLELAEVVAVIAIAHDNELTKRALNTSSQRTSVTACFHEDYARTVGARDGLRPVRAAVIG